MHKHTFLPSIAFLGTPLLALLISCGGGGGGSQTSATKLVYTSSATESEWRVVAEPSTNGTATLLLHVMGPTGTTIKGASVFLSCNAARASWAQPAGATDPYALPGSALDLTQGPVTGTQMFKSHLEGSSLQVGAYQKSGTVSLTSDKPIFSIALSLSPGATTGSAGLATTTGRSAIYLNASGEQPLSLKIGSLVAE